MYSIHILAVVILALITTTNALDCPRIMCRLYCANGYEIDAQGCQICQCRKSMDICAAPIPNYTCGFTNNLDCPKSHECHIDSTSLTGQCCLKRSGSTTISPRTTGATTTKHHTTPTRPHTTTRHHTTTKPHTTTRHHTTTKPHTTTRHHTTTRRASNLLF